MVRGPHRSRGIKVLKAVSSPLRLQILNFLFDKGGLTYTELMTTLKMNPSRDAGKFAYHLKFLLKADLVETDSSSRKYILSDLGKMVLDVADQVEKRTFRQRGMLVRTSHFTLEEFDVNKIAKSLIKEAKVPPDLAQKTAKDAEKRLRKSKAKFITAALVREIVNTILVEKGHENFRHKLTRIGMPVYEVTKLLNSKKPTKDSNIIIEDAGKKLFEEYILLNIFPRDIADAHLLGNIHIENLGTWILKPREIIHDIRFFYEYGLNLPKIADVSISNPKSLDSALTVALNVLLYCKKEVDSSQILDSFNVFLSPFIKNKNISEIKKSLNRFLINISQNVKTTISLDLSISEKIGKMATIRTKETKKCTYFDLIEEIQLIASLIIDIVDEKSDIKPLFNPEIIIKINQDSFNEKNSLEIIKKAHKLSFERGNVFFANISKEKDECKVLSGSGHKYMTDLSGDWETDTLRTGCIGNVAINLHRIAIESEFDKNKFFDILKERFELSARALRIKYNSLKQIGKKSLPFITNKINGDTYFRFENCSRIINLVGFQEAIEKFTGKEMSHRNNQDFSKEIIKNILRFKKKIGRKYGKRLFPVILPSSEASKRLAELDIEKFGLAKVKFSGSRYYPFFSSSRKLELQINPLHITLESIQREKEISRINGGGCLYIIEVPDTESNYKGLLKITQNLIKNKWIEFFTFNRCIAYCENCEKTWKKRVQKCPSCGSLSTIKTFNRFLFT